MALEDLLRYESAAIARPNVGKDNILAVYAMQDFYSGLGLGEDPIIGRALQEAASGGERALANAGLVQAIEVYGGKKYEEAFISTKIADLTKYLTESYSIPQEASRSFKKYETLSIKELLEKAKGKETSENEKEEIGKLTAAIDLLKERRFRARASSIYDSIIRDNLERLYSQKEKKE